ALHTGAPLRDVRGLELIDDTGAGKPADRRAGWIRVQPRGDLLSGGISEGLAEAERDASIHPGDAVAIDKLVVEDANAAAQNGLVVAEGAVSEAEAGSEVL